MTNLLKTYDVVVIGAGHAGCEAALAAARMGASTLVVTLSRETIGHMPCNPAIGGLAKGNLVKEIDALGGAMGRVADETGIQFKVLNRSKGPAVRGTRAQSDMFLYRAAMRRELEARPGLEILEATVDSLVLEGGRAAGVITHQGHHLRGRTVVVTTGTFLNGLVHMGPVQTPAGRRDEPPAKALSASLKGLHLELGRLKTGTVPRLDKHTIDWDGLEIQWGDEPLPTFSFWGGRPRLPQVACHITHTNPTTHQVILENLEKSAMYSGAIQGVGPRYCPSIEDKVVRFPDKTRHHVFLEPTGLESDEIYPNGLSTSLPPDIQQAYLRTIPGLEQVEILYPGYAVEYDFILPYQLRHTLAVKSIPNLFAAGQINGTSGYEEAAAQGLMAGINAALQASGRPPLVLGRDQAYIGVLIDDLITKGTSEPYRMFTSRAEYRLLLREDNADLRLAESGHRAGLLGEDQWRQVQEKQRAIFALGSHLEGLKLPPSPEVNRQLAALGQPPIKTLATAAELVQRPQMDLESLNGLEWLAPSLDLAPYPPKVREQVEIDIKYGGYITRQADQIRLLEKLEALRLPEDLDFGAIGGLSNEVRGKLEKHRPETLAEAGRISGVTPAAVTVLAAWLRARSRAEKTA
ncbi:MAG: tRNA uridine-5-carboxymethylaminomethyl(34) synthesis enzyme MnmG [Deltaproteobacteria bacterium]|nr:tRNA uridine-5-carboxymethylaminomethyl(34) synthesis enzyme MnmG [Deltaproteobacteria bacterium]